MEVAIQTPNHRTVHGSRSAVSRSLQDAGAVASRAQTLIAATLLLLTTTAAHATAPPDGFAARIDALLASLPSGATAALLVEDTDSGVVWYQRNPDAALKPASVLKLFTSAAAIEHLGASFAFETMVYLAGDELWVVGRGDPGLGDERLADARDQPRFAAFDRWAAALRGRGVSQVGKIVLDDGIFDQQWRAPSWDPAQADRWYAAPVGGLNLANNCVDVYADFDGDEPIVRFTPNPGPGFVREALRRADRHTAVVTRDDGSDIFDVRGGVTRSGFIGTAAVNTPTVFFGFALKHALRDRGVTVGGAVARRELSPDALRRAQRLATERTTLREALWRCNTFSQNMFAEALLKSLAAYERSANGGAWRVRRGASRQSAVAVLRRVLQTRGVDLGTARIVDGSGLSHDNRVSARQVVDLLRGMQTSSHAAMFRASLAQPTEPGTLRRWRSDPLVGRMWGKTGSISRVRTLAGYVERSDGQRLAFALLINGANADNLRRRVAEALFE